ncbi:hypothetical protein EXS57_03515 [Candidatus Kaiserbacteria bacterium]|nr:hypothetical protein [Candidatus Kaiserbacteria bacterium]
MTKHVFTKPQAAHALEVVLELMKERRFFLYQDRPGFEKNPSYKLDPQVFGPALELDRKIRQTYAMARTTAEKEISDVECELGVAKPDLSGNKQVVQCNRYTGGLDICRVYPLTAFTQYAPESLEILIEQCLPQILQRDVTEDDMAPKAWRQYRDDAHKTSEKIWKQLQTMGVDDSNNPYCVVVMETRFDCGSSDANYDFMQGRVRGMQKFPHAMGYLFHRYSLHTRIVRHNHVVFSTSRSSHVNVQHWNIEGKPTIQYDAKDGYSCSVIFVTVL